MRGFPGKRFIWWMVLPLGLAACGGDDHGDESIDAEGCEHLIGGPAVAVTASDMATDDAPLVTDQHMRYDIALPGEGIRAGFVRFASGAAGDYVVFLDQAVAFAVVDGDDAEVTLEDSQTGSPECAEVKGRHAFELEVGTYHLRLGPTEVAAVGMVLERDGEHDE
jgi:hypothetical protein